MKHFVLCAFFYLVFSNMTLWFCNTLITSDIQEKIGRLNICRLLMIYVTLQCIF